MSNAAAVSILDEIRRLHDTGHSGVLKLVNGRGERVEVFFREGVIEAASSNIEAHRLGDYLVRLGYLGAPEVETVRSEAVRQKIFFGEAVVRKNFIEQADLAMAVRTQVFDLLDYVFKNDFGVDNFTTALRSYYSPARINFSHVLLEMCRTTAEPLEAGAAKLVLSENADLSLFPWRPNELQVLAELQNPTTFESLVAVTGIREGSLRNILGVLDRLGVLRVIDAELAEGLIRSEAMVKTSDFAFEHLIPVVTNPMLSEKLKIAKSESSFTSEQFKSLKVQLRQANSDGATKVITISSPDAQDGKSLISASLAFSCAMDVGRRVIVVDCDLRSPSLQSYLGVTSEPGLLQYLAEGNLSPYCYVRRIENLYFMTAGGVAPNPIEVLSMNRMKQLIDHLRKDFDTIILDAPPYCPIADARIVTGLSDALIMVLRRGKTTYSSTDIALKSVDRGKLLGIVFNDVQPMLFHTYHNFGYAYGSKQFVYSNGDKGRRGSRLLKS
jgi:capsular exopolysaccharide synthesis family protein